MNRVRNRLLLAAVVVLVLTGVTPAPGQPTFKIPFTVKDNAGLFSADAEAKANKEIAQIKERFHKDLLIETTKELPPDAAKVDFTDKKAKSEFFRKWALDKAK